MDFLVIHHVGAYMYKPGSILVNIVGSFMGCSIQENHQQGWKKGPWTPQEDKLLINYVNAHGEGGWSSVARCSGLNRSGKSCRLRWVNYLRPGLKRGQITPQEEGIIIELHAIWGNKWSTIARYLPGRTDNEIKNYWRTHFKKISKKLRKTKVPKSKSKLQSQAQSQPQRQQFDQVVPCHQENTPTKQDDELFIYPNTIIDDKDLMIAASSWMDATCIDQDAPWWGSLWNFGDQPQQNENTHHCSKMALSLQNQAIVANDNNILNNASYSNSGFTWEGDLKNIYNIEGYIY